MGENDVRSRSYVSVEAVEGLSAASDHAFASGNLYRNLKKETSDVTIGVAVSLSEIASGLNAWLATRDDRCITFLQAIVGGGPAAFSNVAGETLAATIGLYDERRLAVLAPNRDRAPPRGKGPIELISRSYGGANHLAVELRNLVRSWEASGRPSSERLVITVAPHGGRFVKGSYARVVRRGSCTLCFDWAVNSPHYSSERPIDTRPATHPPSLALKEMWGLSVR